MDAIRPVEKRDRAEWLRMRIALWPDHGDARLAEHIENHLAGKAMIAGGSAITVFVAERPDGRLCGFVEVGLRGEASGCESAPVPYLEGWFVDADARRQGIGRELVRAAETWARRNGCREFASDTTEDNDISLKAHTALGFEVVHRLIHFRKPLV